MAQLKLFSHGRSQTFDLARDSLRIGRESTNDVPVPDEHVSSKHAVLRREAGRWCIEDVKSRNGTFVNGIQIQSTLLRDGDVIEVGESRLTFHDEPPAAVVVGGEDDDDGSILQTLFVDSGSGQGIDLSRIAQSLRERRQAKEQRPGAEDELALAEAKLLTIQKVSEKLVRVVDPQRLNEEILAIVLEQTRADRGALCLLDAERQPVPVATHHCHADQPAQISRTVLRRMLQDRCGVLISKAAGVYATLEQMGVTSAMCVPLWTGEEIIGLILLESTKPDRVFTNEDLQLLLVVAHQASIGIERERLAERLRSEEQNRKSLARFLDGRVVERIVTRGGATDPLAPREQQVTILFSDIVSFTKLSEGLPPTEVADFVRNYLTAMTEIVFRHGGTIDKYIGDAIMALFGAPVQGADDAGAAVRAALEMRRALPTIKPPVTARTELRARFGVNTGTVVVGTMGSARRAEYTAIGDAVNVAARIQTFARPNEVCIDESTQAAVGGRFLTEEIGVIDVKNRLQPLTIYKVLGERAPAS